MTAISKSQKADGSYVSASQFTATGRAQHAQNLTRRSRGKANYFQAVHKPAGGPAGRGIEHAYQDHGVGAGIKTALTETTRPSTVHRGVHFGSSVSPQMERKINSHLDPKLVAQAKHHTVFHVGRTVPGVLAGAAPAHATTGGKSRIILGSGAVHSTSSEHEVYADQHGRAAYNLRHIVNHEFSHTLKHSGPRRFHDYKGNIKLKSSGGEEARADAKGMPGKGLYERQLGNQYSPGYSDRLHHLQGVFRGKHSAEPEGPEGRFNRAHTPPPGSHHYEPPGRTIHASRVNKPALIAGGVAAGAGLGLAALHHHAKEKAMHTPVAKTADEIFAKARIEKGLQQSVKQKLHHLGRQLDKISVTPDQARHASVMGQIGGGTGALTGAVVGTGIGAAVKHPAQGAGIGAMAGGALGGSAGAAAGLYAGRPAAAKLRKKTAATVPVAKLALNTPGGAAVAGGVTAIVGANTFGPRIKRKTSNVVGLPVSKGLFNRDLPTKGEAAQVIVNGSVVTAKKTKPLLDKVTKTMDPDKKDKLQRRVATGALGVGALADASAVKAGWNETRRATYAAPKTEGLLPKVGAGLKFASEKGAFPLAVGGLAAAGLAAHVINKPKPVIPPKPKVI